MTKGRTIISKAPHLKVKMGFYDRRNMLNDAETYVGGMKLFRKWFLKRNQGTPHSNVCEFNVGKLVVPRVFVDVDLLMDMAKRYDLVMRVVNNYAGRDFL